MGRVGRWSAVLVAAAAIGASRNYYENETLKFNAMLFIGYITNPLIMPWAKMRAAVLEDQIAMTVSARAVMDDGFKSPVMVAIMLGERAAAAMTWNETTQVRLEVPARADPGRVIPVLCAVPAGCADGTADAPLPLVLHWHGGGMVIGSPEMEEPVIRTLAADVGAVVCSTRYRLAPEHPFPAAVDDALDASLSLLGRTDVGGCPIDPDKFATFGASAGGYMAANAARALANAGRRPRVQVSICPMAKPKGGTDSERTFAAAAQWSRDANQFAWATYLRGAPDAAASWRANLLVDPPASAVGNLPPTHVQVMSFDTLRDEGVAYAERLRALGVLLRLEEFGTTHAGVLPGLADGGAAEAAWPSAVATLKRHLGARPVL